MSSEFSTSLNLCLWNHNTSQCGLATFQEHNISYLTRQHRSNPSRDFFFKDLSIRVKKKRLEGTIKVLMITDFSLSGGNTYVIFSPFLFCFPKCLIKMNSCCFYDNGQVHLFHFRREVRDLKDLPGWTTPVKHWFIDTPWPLTSSLHTGWLV